MASSPAPYSQNNPVALLKKKLRVPSYPPVLAPTPPSVSVLADYAATTISNAQFIQMPSSLVNLTSSGCLALQYTAAVNDGVLHSYYMNNVAYGYGTNINYFCLEMVTDAPRIELLAGQAFGVNIFVDDLPCQAGFYQPANATNNSRHLMQLDFAGVRLVRKIRIEGQLGGNGFAGFYIGPYDSLWPPSDSAPAISFLGDSYLARAGGNSYISEIAAVCSWALGCKCAFVDAVGGTGYYQTNAGVSPTTNNYAERIGVSTTGVVQSDIFCVLGGINDTASLTVAQVSAALNAVRALYPSAVIVVSGNWQPDPLYTRVSPSNKQVTIAATIKSAVQQLSGPWVYISNIDDSWLNSSGVAKAATGVPWQTGDGWQVTFTGTLSSATSGTLTQPFSGATGSYQLVFGDYATIKTVSMTNGSTSVSWSGATTQTSVNAGVYKTTPGNSIVDLSYDGTHPTVPAGADYLARMLAERLYDAVMAL